MHFSSKSRFVSAFPSVLPRREVFSCTMASGGPHDLRSLALLQQKDIPEEAISKAAQAALKASGGYIDPDAPISGKMDSMNISSSAATATDGGQVHDQVAEPTASGSGTVGSKGSVAVPGSNNPSTSSAFRSLDGFKKPSKKVNPSSGGKTSAEDAEMSDTQAPPPGSSSDLIGAEEAARKQAQAERRKAEREKERKERQLGFIKVIDSVAPTEESFKALLAKSGLDAKRLAELRPAEFEISPKLAFFCFCKANDFQKRMDSHLENYWQLEMTLDEAQQNASARSIMIKRLVEVATAGVRSLKKVKSTESTSDQQPAEESEGRGRSDGKGKSNNRSKSKSGNKSGKRGRSELGSTGSTSGIHAPKASKPSGSASASSAAQPTEQQPKAPTYSQATSRGELMKHRFALQLQQWKVDKDRNAVMVDIQKDDWENHIRENFLMSVTQLQMVAPTDDNPTPFSPVFWLKEYSYEDKKCYFVPADEATYEWFTKNYVPNLRIQKWTYRAVKLATTQSMAVVYFTMQDADIKAVSKALGKTVAQLWPTFCQINRLNPNECRLKSTDADPKKPFLRHIKFRATKGIITLLKSEMGARKANQVFFMGSAYGLKVRNEVALQNCSLEQLNWESRGDGPLL